MALVGGICDPLGTYSSLERPNQEISNEYPCQVCAKKTREYCNSLNKIIKMNSVFQTVLIFSSRFIALDTMDCLNY